MSDLQLYVQDAIRTESRIEHVHTNVPNLLLIMRIFVATGNLLDDLKKNIYYNKPIDDSKWLTQVEEIRQLSTHITTNPATFDKSNVHIDPRTFHAIVGLATESAELIEAVLSSLDQNIELDTVNIREELFDVIWYLLLCHDALDKNINGTIKMGFDKLKQRYPYKFTSEAAINRDIQAERDILESYDS